MDFPEVWQIKHQINDDSSNNKSTCFRSFQNSVDKVQKIAKKQNINKMVSILLPETDTTGIVELVNNSENYLIEEFDLTQLLNPKFIESFIKIGSFCCSTTNNPDFEDSFAVIDSELIIKCQKETFQSLKIGSLSEYKVKLSTIRINLNQILSIELQEGLKHESLAKKSIYFTWQAPSGTTVCSSSIASYFSGIGYNVKLCKSKVVKSPVYGLRFPEIPTNLNSPENSDLLSIVAEYIGMVTLGCDLEENEGVTSYQHPENVIDIGKGQIINCRGFFNSEFVFDLIQQIRKIIADNELFPWISIYLHCFPVPGCDNTSSTIIVTKDQILINP